MSGPLPITMTDIYSYCSFVGIKDYDIRENLLHHIKTLDPISLEDFYQKQKAEAQKRSK